MKVNGLILRFVQEEITDTKLSLPLDYDEAWCIDAAFSAESYHGAKLLLIQVMQVIWEHEYGQALKTGVINKGKTGADGVFDPSELVEYVSTRNGKEAEGFDTPPEPSPPSDEPEGTSV